MTQKNGEKPKRINYSFTLRFQENETSPINSLVSYLRTKKRQEVKKLLLEELNGTWLIACLDEYDKEQISKDELDKVSNKVIYHVLSKLEYLFQILVEKDALVKPNYLSLKLAAINEIVQSSTGTSTQFNNSFTSQNQSDLNDGNTCDTSITSVVEGPQYKCVDISNDFNW